MSAQERWYSQELPLRNQTIVDLGANIGLLSEFFWTQGKGTNQIISVEPLPQNIKKIEKRIRKANADNRWKIEQCVCSSSNEASLLKVQKTHEDGWNSVIIEQEDIQEIRTLTVPSKTLDQICGHASVVKVDIEGHEYAIFDHSLKSLKSINAWALELHMRPDRPLETVLKQFEEEGFTLIAATASPNQNGRWQSLVVDSSLSWDQIPVAKTNIDGSVFKMLHIIAKRNIT